MRRVIYLHDILMAMYDKGISKQFEAWADVRYPDIPSYIQVVEWIAAERGKEQLYDDVMTGKFSEEINNAPRV